MSNLLHKRLAAEFNIAQKELKAHLKTLGRDELDEINYDIVKAQLCMSLGKNLFMLGPVVPKDVTDAVYNNKVLAYNTNQQLVQQYLKSISEDGLSPEKNNLVEEYMKLQKFQGMLEKEILALYPDVSDAIEAEFSQNRLQADFMEVKVIDEHSYTESNESE